MTENQKKSEAQIGERKTGKITQEKEDKFLAGQEKGRKHSVEESVNDSQNHDLRGKIRKKKVKKKGGMIRAARGIRKRATS